MIISEHSINQEFDKSKVSYYFDEKCEEKIISDSNQVNPGRYM